MTALTVVGGLYREDCVWPEWHRLFGSGGRAAAAVVEHVDSITLRTYASPAAAAEFRPQADTDGIDFHNERVEQTVAFSYSHSLATPSITPTPSRIHQQQPMAVSGTSVLRFGMMEGTARVDAEWCVYDPQSAFTPEPFAGNGSRATHLAVVANRGEVSLLGDDPDPLRAATLLLQKGAEVVVVKAGASGAHVVSSSGSTLIPPYHSNSVWTLGSGDVFAALFAAAWGVHRLGAVEAARLASMAVASYAQTMALPVPSFQSLRDCSVEVNLAGGRVYLAGPFFTLGERWLVDEARRGLQDLGLSVFSPVHDVGPGEAHEVAPADLQALRECDAVLALLDGLDSGTLFEVGYARALAKPVYALAQNVSIEDLKMIEGSCCRVYTDFVTALHHCAWRV